MGDKFNVKEVNNTNGQLNIGRGNTQTETSETKQPKESVSIFKTLWLYLGLAVFIYALVVAVLAWDLQKKGMTGNKAFKEIVLSPLEKVSEIIKSHK